MPDSSKSEILNIFFIRICWQWLCPSNHHRTTYCSFHPTYGRCFGSIWLLWKVAARPESVSVHLGSGFWSQFWREMRLLRWNLSYFRSETLFRRCRSCSLPSWFIRKCLWCGIIRRTGKSDRKHSWVCISIENHSIQYRFLAKFTAFWHIQGPPNQDPDHWAGSYDQNTSLGTAEGRSMAGIVGSDTHRDHRIRFVKKKYRWFRVRHLLGFFWIFKLLPRIF